MFLLDEAVAEGEGPVLSVYAEAQRPGELMTVAVERICRIADLPHRQVLVTSVACLREIGVDVVPSIDAGEAVNHHHVVFAEPLAAEQVAEYVKAWNEPVPNPTGGKKRPT